MSSQKPRVEDSDEDLDDLDDVLDQFTPAPPKPSGTTSATLPPPPPPTAKSSTLPTTQAQSPPPIPTAADVDFGDDFAAELARGMESLMREIGASGEVGRDGAEKDGETEEEKEERERAFRAAWEALMVEGMDGAMGDSGAAGAGLGDPFAGAGKQKDKDKAAPSTGPGGDKADFQKGIRAAMDKLKESESTLNQGNGSADPESLEALLAQLADLGGGEGGLGEGGEEELAGMLENMMGQLMSKDVLYEPLKELGDKFPSYLATNASTLSVTDKKRYEAQLDRVHKIVAVFDDPGYREENPEVQAKVVALMNEMQSFGAPPSEIMGPLPPGFALGADGMPEGCVIA